VKSENTVSPIGAILAVVASFVLILFAGGISAIFLGYGPASIIIELALILVPFSYLLSKHVSVKNYIGLKIDAGSIGKGVAFGGALFLFDLVVASVLTTIFGQSQTVAETNQIILDLTRSPIGLLYITVGLLLAGVCEEFVFRAFLQNTINRRHSFTSAMVISSLAFGLFHFDPQVVYVLATFLAGLLLGFIYHRYNSYITCAVAHSTLNIIILTILVLTGI
jgi:membrane protease YdiL (CAAX protease family)